MICVMVSVLVLGQTKDDEINTSMLLIHKSCSIEVRARTCVAQNQDNMSEFIIRKKID